MTDTINQIFAKNQMARDKTKPFKYRIIKGGSNTFLYREQSPDDFFSSTT
jgi:hypothetical protein